MTAWYASLLGHQTIGVAMGDLRVQYYVEKLACRSNARSDALPAKRKNDLTRLARSFDQSCQYAYKDPCSRVGRDPLRKLSAFERVFSSVAYNVFKRIFFLKRY